MPLPSTTARALGLAGIDFREDEQLVKKTWWRVGGPADGWVDAEELETLCAVQRVALETGCPVTVMGNASNMLVADSGIRGIVVHLGGRLTEATQQGADRVRLGAGLKLVAMLKRCERGGWTGLEWAAGVPGTVGGAIRMNAGTRLGEVKDSLVDATVVLRDGSTQTLTRDALKMAYRHCRLPEGAIIAYGTFQLTGGDPHESQRRITEHLAQRAATQPTDVPTCGSTFRNPHGDAAGRLIEACGLKGHVIGRARVSSKHANFIVNLGGATAGEIRKLIDHVQTEVWHEEGVMLEPEVVMVGDWGVWDPESTL